MSTLVMNTHTTTPERAFANAVNTAFPLPAQQEPDEMDGHNFGRYRKTYYERSPYCSIEAFQYGCIVHNHVVGSVHYAKSWDEAMSLRNQIAGRYKTITAGMRSNVCWQRL